MRYGVAAGVGEEAHSRQPYWCPWSKPVNVETWGHVSGPIVMAHALAELRCGIVVRQHENGFKSGRNFNHPPYAVEDFSSLAIPPYQELDDSRLFAIHLIRAVHITHQLRQMPHPQAMYVSTPSMGASILATSPLVRAASDVHSKPRRATSPCGLLRCPSNSHISPYEASKHVLHS